MAIILRAKDIEGLWSIGQRDPTPRWQRTLSGLKTMQARYVAQHASTASPEELTTPIAAYIGNGAWRIHCRCGEATHTDPEWQQACCFGCGAIYTQVTFPPNALDIETLLAKRPVQGTRNWEAPETYEDLLAEQMAHGDPV